MREIIQRTNQDITPNTWFLNVIKALQLHLDGQHIDITVRYAMAQNEMVALKLMADWALLQLNPEDLNGVTITSMCDMGDYQTDLVIRIDFSNIDDDPHDREPEKWQIFSRLVYELSTFSIKDISFKDWNTTDPIEISWVDHALRVTIPFESSGKEVAFKKLCIEKGVNINGFRLHINLVPYVFWFPDVTYPKDKNGQEYQYTPVAPNKDEYCFWPDLRNLYKQCCTIFIDSEWTTISPEKIMGKDIPKLLRNALKDLSNSLSKSVPKRLLFKIFEKMVLFENPLDLSLAINLASGDPSRLRGVDIKPNNARFLYFDEFEDAVEFQGTGIITGVRKCKIYSDLNKSGATSLKIDKRYRPDNIIELKIMRDDGQEIIINTLNLVESVLRSRREPGFVCTIQNAHVVIRTRNWGHVAYTKLPWKDVLTGAVISDWGMESITNKERLLKYPGYMRDNPDNSEADNLDNLPEYAYSFSDPLYRNIYNGLLFFVLATRKYGGIKRTLYIPEWKFPYHDDRSVYQITDRWLERSR